MGKLAYGVLFEMSVEIECSVYFTFLKCCSCL